MGRRQRRQADRHSGSRDPSKESRQDGKCLDHPSTTSITDCGRAMKLLIGCMLVACLVGAGCGGASPTHAPTPTATPTPQTTAAPTSAGTATLAPGEPTPTPTPVPTEAPTATSSGATAVSISMVSAAEEVRPGQEFNVDVNLSPRQGGIRGVEFEIDFDPAILQIADVEPGTLLGEKPEDIQSDLPSIGTDEKAGILHYADVQLGALETPSPPGTVATIRFRVLADAAAGVETALRFTEVKIPDEEAGGYLDVVIGDELRVKIVL